MIIEEVMKDVKIMVMEEEMITMIMEEEIVNYLYI